MGIRAKSISAFGLQFVFFVSFFLMTKVALSNNEPNKIEGPNACAECHTYETEVWKKSHHFKTFRAMPRSKKAKEIAKKLNIRRMKNSKLCTNCHFTMQEVRKKPKAISGISCESCHSAGKDFIKIHSEFSGKTEKTETKAEEVKRWKLAESKGMIRPRALYKLAKNCYSCHVVPQEKLVNVGGHPAGSKFELVSWSQGEVRHNLLYTKGKENKEASASRKRMLYIVGLIVEFETAFRAVGIATQKKEFAILMARRADAARKKIKKVSDLLGNVPELKTIVTLTRSAGLKLNNKRALTLASNKVADETVKFLGKYDGSGFAAIDSLIPSANKYVGEVNK